MSSDDAPSSEEQQLMTHLKVGDIVRWTAKDDKGDFTHIGKVKKVTDSQITLSMKPQKGEMTILLTDGTFEVIKDKDNIGTSLDTSGIDEIEVVKSPPLVATPKPGSKLERAIVIVESNPKATRKELIVMFMEQLQMSQAGASTYVHNAKQALKKKQ